MAQTEERLKSPSLQECKRIKLAIDQMINDGADVELSEPDAVTVCEALDWIVNFLDNRRLYHKKRNFSMNEEKRIMEEALRGRGFDVQKLKQEAARRVADRVVDEAESD